MVRYLVTGARDLRINIDQCDNVRRTALFYAFENSQLTVVQFLLSHGAKLHPADHNKNIIMCACLKNNVTVLSYCLRNLEQLGLSLSDEDDKGRNVLFYAVTGGNSEALELLIQAGACVQASPDGINLLMQAAGKRQLDVGRYDSVLLPPIMDSLNVLIGFSCGILLIFFNKAGIWQAQNKCNQHNISSVSMERCSHKPGP